MESRQINKNKGREKEGKKALAEGNAPEEGELRGKGGGQGRGAQLICEKKGSVELRPVQDKVVPCAALTHITPTVQAEI